MTPGEARTYGKARQHIAGNGTGSWRQAASGVPGTVTGIHLVPRPVRMAPGFANTHSPARSFAVRGPVRVNLDDRIGNATASHGLMHRLRRALHGLLTN